MKKILFTLCIIALAMGLYSEADVVVEVISENADNIILEMRLADYDEIPVEASNKTYYHLQLSGESITKKAGYPAVPKVVRNLVIPPTTQTFMSILETEYTHVDKAIMPSKGIIYKPTSPDSIPFSFGDIYTNELSYPPALVTLGEPYILRDYRGQTITFFPFISQPSSDGLTIYTRIRVQLSFDGYNPVNAQSKPTRSINRDFVQLYNNQFINSPADDAMISESELFIFATQSYTQALAPYIEWKNQMGMKSVLFTVADAGVSCYAIKQYILNAFNTDISLSHVLLIGDAAVLPTYTFAGGGADPMYSLLVGSDNYPDIYVGRFSVESPAELASMVEKSIYYERDLATLDWVGKATGIASQQGDGIGDDGESDWVHMDNIRTNLLNSTYSQVDRLYYTLGATDEDVTAAVNAGRGFINYCGHGNVDKWNTTYFTNTHVNALTNDFKYPFICSVACKNGRFAYETCFAETWMRATNPLTNNPTGAIAIYASSINQSWTPPMAAQDEMTDIVAGETRQTMGSLFYAGACLMMSEYSSSVEIFKTWNIFGDPSLMIRTATPRVFDVAHSDYVLSTASSFAVSTGEAGSLICLSGNDEIIAAGYTDNDGNIDLNYDVSEVTGTCLLTVTGFNMECYQSEIDILAEEPDEMTAPQSVVIELVDTHPAISWQGVGRANGYHIYRSHNPRNSFQQIGISIENTFVDTTASAEDIYFYRITAE